MYEMKGASYVHRLGQSRWSPASRPKLSTLRSTGSPQLAGCVRRLAGAPGRCPESSPGNNRENTIAPFCVTNYHAFMTPWQTLKQAGYMHPISSLDAALSANRRGVVVV